MFHTYLNMFPHLFGHEFASLSSYYHISVKMCSHLFGHNLTFPRSGAVAMTRPREEPMIVIRPPGGIVFTEFQRLYFHMCYFNFGNKKRSCKLHCNDVQQKQSTSTYGYILRIQLKLNTALLSHCPCVRVSVRVS